MPSVKRLGAACGLILVAAMLAGCAPEPDLAASRDALREVTEEPAPPEAVDEYDATAFPEPIVEAADCTPYLVVTARGTAEPRKKQLLGPVARAIEEARPDEVSRVDLDYPADTEVHEGATLGTRLLVDTLNVQAAACPEQRFVLLGYSQGALVIGDAIAEPETRLVGARVGELTAAAADRVLAVVLYGNPRFVGSDPTGYGDYDPALNGLLPRPPESLTAFEERLRDYCVADDFICQSTLAMEEEGHVAYYDNGMQDDGAAFVISKLAPRAAKSDDKGGDKADEKTDENTRDRASGGASDGAASEAEGDAGDGVETSP